MARNKRNGTLAQQSDDSEQLKPTRTYLQYRTEDQGIVQLTFSEGEESMQKHIEENKISDNDIVYKGDKRPKRPKNYPLTQKQIKDLEELLYCLHPSLDWD